MAPSPPPPAVSDPPLPPPAVAALRARARACGFDVCAIARARLSDQVRADLAGHLAAGHHGTMAWMADTADRRGDPRRLWPEVVSVISLGLGYAPAEDPRCRLARPDRGAISVYAHHRDYHDVLKGRAKTLAQWIAARLGGAVKVFVDTAPVMEKPLAQVCGLGWQGKHTNLVNRRHGSWLFLAEVFSTLLLPADPPHPVLCGRCTRCLDACPTGALVAAHRIDARRCLSYLTIEHKGPIPRPLRPLLGNRVYGCDDCLAPCPWNRFAPPTTEPAFQIRPALIDPPLVDLAGLDEAGFRRLFSASPVKRLGRDRFVRNALVALGNDPAPTAASLTVAEARLQEANPLVRGAAVWALRRLADRGGAILMPPDRLAALQSAALATDPDPLVRTEWTAPMP